MRRATTDEVMLKLAEIITIEVVSVLTVRVVLTQACWQPTETWDKFMRCWRIQVRFVLKINIKQYKLIITFMLGEAFVGIRSVGTGGVFTDSLFSA